MCDPEIIAAILEDLGYLGKKKEKEKKDEVYEKENIKADFRKAGEGEQKWHQSVASPLISLDL